MLHPYIYFLFSLVIYMQFILCYVIIIEYFNTFLSSYSKTRSIIHEYLTPYFIIVKRIKFHRAFHNHNPVYFQNAFEKGYIFLCNKWQSFILSKWPNGNRTGNHVSLSLWFCHGDRFISTFNSQMAEEISGEKVFFNHLIISSYSFFL